MTRLEKLAPLLSRARRPGVVVLAIAFGIVGGIAAGLVMRRGATSAPVVATINVNLWRVNATPAMAEPAAAAPDQVEATSPDYELGKPILDGWCVVHAAEDLDAAASEYDRTGCGWGQGLPAVSRDGTHVALMHSSESGADVSEVEIWFVDTRTSKIVRKEPILEIAEAMEVWSGSLEGPAREALVARVAKRVARVQRRLDAAGFRSIELLRRDEGDLELEVAETFSMIALRLVDTTTATVIWQERYRASEVAPFKGEVARHVFLRWAAWDPSTRTLLTLVHYEQGGSYWGWDVPYVYRLDDA